MFMKTGCFRWLMRLAVIGDLLVNRPGDLILYRPATI
jgi:hypothetical protein